MLQMPRPAQVGNVQPASKIPARASRKRATCQQNPLPAQAGNVQSASKIPARANRSGGYQDSWFSISAQTAEPKAANAM